MDLYGSSASIAQANAQTEAARQINEATKDFNDSLAEELDQANLEEDENRQQKLTKNIASAGTATYKLAAKKELRQPSKIIKGAKEGVFRKVSKEERFAREPASPELGAASTLEEGEQITADVAGQTGEQTAEQTATAVAEREGTEGIETSAKALAKKAAEDSIEKAGLKTAGKLASKAMTAGRIGAAGLGGALDIGSDVGRLIEGKRGMDAFGSNSASRVGNILNIAGSGLEVLGVATGGVTPWSLAMEGLGASIGLIGAVTEGFGEEEASEKAKAKAEKDITSQARGDVAASQVTQVVGRTQ
tara:strand:- start:7399 stop:8310 length:912 start_codon:yes stop_codon:yes gene_type:complete